MMGFVALRGEALLLSLLGEATASRSESEPSSASTSIRAFSTSRTRHRLLTCCSRQDFALRVRLDPWEGWVWGMSSEGDEFQAAAPDATLSQEGGVHARPRRWEREYRGMCARFDTQEPTSLLEIHNGNTASPCWVRSGSSLRTPLHGRGPCLHGILSSWTSGESAFHWACSTH